jgi:hypothetical protein
MTRFLKWLSLAVAAVSATVAMAQVPDRAAPLSRAELDQVLAPIALYPDTLLSDVLAASTNPRDVAEAASWSRVYGLRGEDAVRAAQDRGWDPSVVALTAFPEVLEMLDARRDWSMRLADAFIAQPEEVMDTVQDLRARADAAGNLRSSEEMVVQRQGDDYVIEPPAPEYLYVPYYDPRVVYGDWWWSAYPPVYWAAWPGYAVGYRHYGLCWGPRVWLGSGWFHYARFDWSRRHFRYASHRPWYYQGRDWQGGTRWRHDGDRRTRDGDRWSRDGDRWSRDGDRWNRRGDRPARPMDGTVQRAAAPQRGANGFFRPQPPMQASTQPAARPALPPQLAEGTARVNGRRYANAPWEFRHADPSQATVMPAPQPQMRSMPAYAGASPVARAAPVARPQAAPAQAHSAPAATTTAQPVMRAARTAPAASPVARGERAERGTGRAGRER